MSSFVLHTSSPFPGSAGSWPYPRISKPDDNQNYLFNKKLYALFGKKPLKILDLGCTGGAFVNSCIDDGQLAAGLAVGPAANRTGTSAAPLVPDSWFVHDPAAEFQMNLIEKDPATETAALFDTITSWDFIEHVPKNELYVLARNVLRHLAPGGLWILSISPVENTPSAQGPSEIRDKHWWMIFFQSVGFVNHAGLIEYFGNDWVYGPLQGSPVSFPLVLTRVTEVAPTPPISNLFDIPTLFRAAQLFLKQGNLSYALQMFKDAEKYFLKSAQFHYVHAYLLFSIGQSSAAEPVLARILALDHEHAGALALRDKLAKEKERLAAESAVRQTVKLVFPRPPADRAEPAPKPAPAVRTLPAAGRPLFSVITPSRNCAPSIRACLESVLLQNHGTFEHIVVDEGSKDGTVDILNRYPHLKWISEPDRGRGEALNKALRMATGEIVVVLDAGARLEGGAFQVVAARLNPKAERHVVFGNTRVADQTGKRVSDRRGCRGTDFAFLLRPWLAFQHPQPSSTFYTRELVNDIGPFNCDVPLSADYDYWLRIALKYKLHHVDRFLSTCPLGEDDARAATLESHWRVALENLKYIDAGDRVVFWKDYYHFLLSAYPESCQVLMPPVLREAVLGLAQALAKHKNEESAEDFIGTLFAHFSGRESSRNLGIAARAAIDRENPVRLEGTMGAARTAAPSPARQAEAKADAARTPPFPRLLIDAATFQHDGTRCARIWHALLREWATQDFAGQILVLDRAGMAPKLPGLRYRTIPAFLLDRVSHDRALLQQVCDEEKADLFLSTVYTTPRTTPTVLMVYDLALEVLGANPARPSAREKHCAIRHASACVCISQNTARDLMRLFPVVAPASVAVVPCGVGPAFFPRSADQIEHFREKYRIRKPYFLLVGDFGSRRQDWGLFFPAFFRLANRDSLAVVLAGEGNLIPPEYLPGINPKDIHRLHLNDEELAQAYAGALAFPCSSVYEDFGMPIVEAMACGCPVVAPAGGAIFEMAGAAPLYAAGADRDAFADALVEVQKPEARAARGAAGREQVRNLSWSQMAESLGSVLARTAERLRGDQGRGLLGEAALALDEYTCARTSSKTLQDLRRVRSVVVERLYNLPTAADLKKHEDLRKACDLLMDSDVKREPLLDEERVLCRSLSQELAKGLQEPENLLHLQTYMLYGWAGQLSLPCALKGIPDWFLQRCARFLFSQPPLFQEPAEADNHARFIERWVGVLHANIMKSSAEPFWQQAALAFSRQADFRALYLSRTNLRETLARRGDILEVGLRVQGHQLEHRLAARSPGRARIRLGILVERFDSQAGINLALPLFEHLDRRQFEVFLYALHADDNPLERHGRKCADRWVRLPAELSAQAETVRAEDLDILYFGANLTAATTPLTLLAAHRLARIQAAGPGNPATTGLKNMDYFLAGQFLQAAAGDADHFREQLAFLPGSGLCFQRAVRPPAIGSLPNRYSLDIPATAVLYFSSANGFKIVPDPRETWAKILASVPGSVLVLCPSGPGWGDSRPERALKDALTRALQNHGVAPARLVLVEHLPNPADVQVVMKMADVFLDAFPLSGMMSILDPLEAGVPPVVLEGNALRSRRSAALVRELGMEELIAADAADYVRKAVELGTNPHRRQFVRDRIQQRMISQPAFFNGPAYAVQVGRLFMQLFQKWKETN